MKYVSVCAGIEAATVAWHPLGWEPALFSEIEPFPRAVLQHHYPNVPLVGDFTELLSNPPEAELLVGGTPCQAFSVAGKRLSLEDYRGNLSLAFADLFHAGQYRWAVWENVPGVLSTKDNAFGCFLGRMVGADAPLLPGRGNKWTNAGVVSGPQATAAWRILDAQYFGVAQRRRRVFVCVSRGAGFECARALLPVGESLSGHPPARPQAGQNIAADAGTGVARSLRGQGNDPHRADVATYDVSGSATGYRETGQGWWTEGPASIRANPGGMPENIVVGALDTECGFTKATDQTVRNGHILAVPHDPVPQVLRNREGKAGGGKGPLISENQSLTLATNNDQVVFALQNPTLEKEQNGLGVSDGPMYTLESSRPHGVVAIPFNAQIVTRHEALGDGTGLGIGEHGDPAYTLQSAHSHGVFAFDDRNHAASATTHHTLRSDGIGSRVSDFVTGFHNRQDPCVSGDVSNPLGANDNGLGVLQLRPRRLTPEECEKLQAFPVGYTNIPWKNGTAPDGPRYKALGNSMCVNVMAWIGKRIQLVEES